MSARVIVTPAGAFGRRASATASSGLRHLQVTDNRPRVQIAATELGRPRGAGSGHDRARLLPQRLSLLPQRLSHSWLQARFPVRTPEFPSAPRPRRPRPAPPVAAFPQAPSAPHKAPPRFNERDSLPERFIRESRSLNFTPSTPAQMGWKWVECTGLGSRGRVGRERRSKERPVPGIRGRPRCAQGQAVASASSSVKPRVLLGSTGMPGPIVVANVTFFRYRPLAAAGLSLITSSRAAA